MHRPVATVCSRIFPSSYNSQNTQNDILGYGWSLNIPYIQRLNKTGSQDLYNANYFTSSLDGELGVINTTPTDAVLVVAGGGSGGTVSGTGDAGGGGGAGGVIALPSYAVSVQSYQVTIGSGGQAVSGTAQGVNGTNSSFGTLIAIGGGGGAGGGLPNGLAGGSGGGSDAFGTGGSGVSGQGNMGGSIGGTGPRTNYAGAGGGDAAYITMNGIFGLYGAGGGGGAGGVGGKGGGGNGSTGSTAATNGATNTGAGGGGATGGGASASGGSGIVVVSYPNSMANNYVCGGTLSVSGANTLCTFTNSGVFTVLSVPGGTTTSSAPATSTSPLAANLVSYWKLDETSGNASDATGNGCTLTNNNGTTPYSAGIINNGAAPNISGTGQYLNNLNFSNAVKGVPMTVSGWMNVASGGSQMIGIRAPDSDNTQAWIAWAPGNYVNARYGKASAMITTNLPTAGAWHFFALTDNGTAVTLYIDGVSQATANYSGYFSGTNRPFTIGNGGDKDPTSYYAGKVDEVGVWSRALSAAEVIQLYNAGKGLAYPFPANAASSTPTTAAVATTTYMGRIDDGSFRQYTYSASTNSWTMYDKSGTQYLFGASAQSQMSAQHDTEPSLQMDA